MITADGKFVVFTIAPLKADVDKAKKDKKKPEEQPKTGLGIMNLATGEVTTVDRVKSFKVPEESGVAVAYLMEPPVKKPDEKKDETKEGRSEERARGEARPSRKRKSKDGKKRKEKKKEPGHRSRHPRAGDREETTSPRSSNTPGQERGLAGLCRLLQDAGERRRLRPGDGRRQDVTLLKGLGNYKGFAFDEKGGQLAFISDRDDYKADARPSSSIIGRGGGSSRRRRSGELAPAGPRLARPAWP